MKIIALSDLHGHLVQISESADVLVIAGDFSPLYCQQDPIGTIGWIESRLIPWFKKLNVSDFIIVPGNHDFACTYSFFNDDLKTILSRHELIGRVHYLNRSSVKLFGKKFYGIPDTEGLLGWAFSNKFNVDYSFDKDTDILVTHQPPKVSDIGFVSAYNKDFGSIELRNVILNSNIEANICGHIHTGQHGGYNLSLNNGKIACIYNVSILDEDYNVAFEPTVIEI